MNATDSQLKTRILVVDGEPAIQLLLESALTDAGFEIEVASSAQEGLDRMVSFNASVAIVDIRLPGDMDGLVLCRHLREDYGVDVVVIMGIESEYGYVDAVDSGASDFIVKPVKIEELILRCERVIESRRICQTRDRSIRELRRRAVTDTLTGLFTSGHLFHQLQTETARSARYAHNVSLCMLDVDHFKSINDHHGHLEGDRALVLLLETIRSVMRESDEAFRYGGEEFVLLLPETDCDSAMLVAERLRSAAARNTLTTDQGVTIETRISVGVAEWQKGEEIKSFLKRADQALYMAKSAGRNRVVRALQMTVAD